MKRLSASRSVAQLATTKPRRPKVALSTAPATSAPSAGLPLRPRRRPGSGAARRWGRARRDRRWPDDRDRPRRGARQRRPAASGAGQDGVEERGGGAHAIGNAGILRRDRRPRQDPRGQAPGYGSTSSEGRSGDRRLREPLLYGPNSTAPRRRQTRPRHSQHDERDQPSTGPDLAPVPGPGCPVGRLGDRA